MIYIKVQNILLPALLSTVSNAWAQNRATIVKREVPSNLYHWISSESINKEKKTALVERGFLPLPRMYPDFNLVTAAPKLAYTKGLFVWSHPIGGVGTGPLEIYGDLGALIAIKVREGRHTVLELETDADSKPIDLKGDLRRIDIIHHKRYINFQGNRILHFEEWVIKKPRIAAEFTADPTILRPLIRQQIEFMKSGGQYSDADLHTKIAPSGRYNVPFVNSDFARKEYIYPRLENYLRLRTSSFHPSWLKPFTTCDEMSLEFGIDP
jgi:hypothetical protein